jgi:hypothetical protein
MDRSYPRSKAQDRGVPQSKMAVNAAKAAIENAIRVKPEKKQAMQ